VLRASSTPIKRQWPRPVGEILRWRWGGGGQIVHMGLGNKQTNLCSCIRIRDTYIR